MKRDDDDGGDRDSWGQILSRCGPGLAVGEAAASTPQAIETNERGPPASRRPRVTRSHIAMLIGLTLAASVAIPQGLQRREQEKAGAGNELKTTSIGTLSSTLVSREPLAGEQPPTFVLKEPDPESGSAGDVNKAVASLPSATDNTGGPYLPAESKAGQDEPARKTLQARLPGPSDSMDSGQPAATDAPANAAALGELRMRQDFDGTGMPQLLAQSSSFNTKDAQFLIDRGKELMSLGDVVTARLIFLKVMDSGYAEGAFNLAQSYDTKVLEALPVHAFVKGDAQKAKMLYALAEETEKTISLSQ